MRGAQRPPHVRGRRGGAGGRASGGRRAGAALASRHPLAACCSPAHARRYRALPKYVGDAPGSPRYAAPVEAPASPKTDPLSYSPAYVGQPPIGRCPDGRNLYKTMPGPGY